MSLYCSQFTNMFEIALPIGSLPEASASVSKAKSLNPVTGVGRVLPSGCQITKRLRNASVREQPPRQVDPAGMRRLIWTKRLLSLGYPRIAPTHTFTNAPSDLEVLIIPGGLGTRSPNAGELVQFVKETYPRLRYLITVCTGAAFAAKAGLLDGRRATTNKRSWAETTEPWAGTVRWVPRARWVEDGNVWTSSGISAGIDATLGFVAKVYGQANATHVANLMEYGWHEDPSWDPFSDAFDVPGRD
ncbi:hypothetical protein RB601_002137 [Gaeumannomyces tritici]